MLSKIKLINFQKHRDLEVAFPGGLTALRGSNEAGKSTLLRAICYALFGVKALNESLDETVTWGEPVNTLKVELDISVDNVVYSIKRGKSGAEVNYDGGMVTGQNEVTGFVCRLLKADAGSASRLMLSNQNEIRGALEAGPKATTELIEKLAEFDQIDHLIELMQEKLALGSSAAVEAALDSARTQLDHARELAVPPETASIEALITDAQERSDSAGQQVALTRAAEAVAQEAQAAVRERLVKRDGLIRDAARSAGRVHTLAAKLAELEAVKAPVGSEAKCAALLLQITEAGSAAEIAAAYAAVKPFLNVRADTARTWPGTVDQLKAQLAAGVALESPANAEVVRLDGEIRLLKQSLTHGSCTFCGKDFSGVPEVAEKNAGIQAQLDSAIAARAARYAELAALGAANEDLRNIEMASRPALKALAATEAYAELADDTLPPMLRWVGPDVDGEPEDVPALQRQINELQKAQRAYEDAQLQAGTARAQLDAARIEDSDLQDALVALPKETLADTQDALDAARAASASAQTEQRAASEALRDAERALKDAKAAYERALAAVDFAQGAVTTRSNELATLTFNNALLKRVRAARPLISDKLWNLVLAAVGSYFSEIRGVKSKVTKAGDGFKVDGHPVTTLSGSTLDALGLAIRVALVRTFLPTAPFLILDEPSAAMDVERTANMLGFLSNCGFNQVLLVTHSDMPEDVADHVLSLGDM